MNYYIIAYYEGESSLSKMCTALESIHRKRCERV